MTPTLVYDGDCGFCTTSAGLARRIAPAVDVVAWQLTDLDELGVAASDAAAAVQLVADDGTVYGGAAAVAALLVVAGGLWAVLGRLLRLPVVRSVAEVVYRLVARYRYRLPGGTPACRLPT
jgi:predicted DCC family thiol-disulfide oxidoreductase YuxK